MKSGLLRLYIAPLYLYAPLTIYIGKYTLANCFKTVSPGAKFYVTRFKLSMINLARWQSQLEIAQDHLSEFVTTVFALNI